jgi:hypothetical protein
MLLERPPEPSLFVNHSCTLPLPTGPDCELRAGGFSCPRCKARVGELPSRCHVCGLTLVSSPHLARSYHHLFPVRPFQEVGEEELWGIQVGLARPGLAGRAVAAVAAVVVLSKNGLRRVVGWQGGVQGGARMAVGLMR